MSPEERLRLLNRLNQLTAQNLDKLIFALQPPSGILPSDKAAQGDRVVALLSWAESSTGPGLGEVEEFLIKLDQGDPLVINLGPNPYKGLLAFGEGDRRHYFGRSTEIQTLWTRFREIHQSTTATRLLPIYGPSGSGKSSLARAGLLAELRQRPLLGLEQAQITTMVPGNHPLNALAIALARLVDGDATPAKKSREFAEELARATKTGDYDGLQRIASTLPAIATNPLILLVDQFEEVYSLCKSNEECDQLIANLLYACQDTSRYVSVIITCRSDFLGHTQQHPALNKLFSSQGFLVPIMQPEGLAEAIAEPAKQAGYEFNPATVQLLVEQTRGHQGALPLLQFALQRIWDGLEQGYTPLVTLEQIGGVGGALAEQAKQMYEALSPEEKKIAPRIFLALVQIEEGNSVTRRSARKSELISNDKEIPQIEGVINRFADPGIRFLVTSFSQENGQVIEVAHEALIQNWKQLQDWIAECRVALQQKRKIEQEALEWEKKGKEKGYLLQGRPLRDAREFMKTTQTSQSTELSSLAAEFVRISQSQSRKNFLVRRLTGILTLILIPPISYFWLLSRAQAVLSADNCKPRPDARFIIQFLVVSNLKNQLRGSNLCGISLKGIYLSNVDMSSSDLSKSNLTRAIINESDLSEISFKDANLMEAKFTGGTFLEKSDFTNASLENSNFEGAYLGKSDFTNAFLRGANMSNTYLAEAVFRNADLTDVNLKGSQGLVFEQLSQAKLCRTRLPDYIINSRLEERCS
ncbi:MAG: pentapeptide repeat-containing protein [Leptolyngbyaceae cyanobacterium]